MLHHITESATVPSLLGERVVLCGSGGEAIGLARKSQVHHSDTPLHLAFSCYVFGEDGQILATQRSFSKRTWPGSVTNSCCGHPLPGEPLSAAVRRRLEQELSVYPAQLDIILPTFRYHARMTNGTLENELCPVFRAIVPNQHIRPAPSEVEVAWWTPWRTFVGQARRAELAPWCSDQVAALEHLGPIPLTWRLGDARDLPAAAWQDLGAAASQA
jgi:isopentenyl-diphosphate delta-isomerase